MNAFWVFAIGIVGGVANSILVESGFVTPRMVRYKDRTIWMPGCLGNFLLGGIAALATYWLGASKLEIGSQLGIALISGLGGGNVLTSLMQKNETSVLRTQMEGIASAIKGATEAPTEEQN